MRWGEGFLRNRKQRVCIRGVQYKWLDVWSGVPQGSVLGPALFLIFISDVVDDTQSSVKLFVDDAKLYRRIKDPQDRQLLQTDSTSSRGGVRNGSSHSTKRSVK